jgi:pilus assembly protein CpaF
MIPEPVFAHSLRALLSPIAPLLDDPEVSEVMLNGASDVFVERRGRLERTDACFESEDALRAGLRVVAQFVGRPFDDEHPILEARLPDGSRVEAIAAPLARGGTHVSIRRFARDTLTPEALVRGGSISKEALRTLAALVVARKNIVVAGGTGTGKTSLLNVLSGFIPAGERLIVLEDARELSPRGSHVVQLECRPADARGRGAIDIRALLKATLRMRPDRIVVGEIRDGAALELVQAMTSGHAGCLSTVHASSPRDALARLETMALMADLELPLQALRGQLASAIDVIVQVERARSGQRVISHVTAVGELDAMGRYMSTDLYARSGSDAPLEPAPRLAQELAQLGIDPAALTHLDRSYP